MVDEPKDKAEISYVTVLFWVALAWTALWLFSSGGAEFPIYLLGRIAVPVWAAFLWFYLVMRK